jgi:hypothetical protein
MCGSVIQLQVGRKMQFHFCTHKAQNEKTKSSISCIKKLCMSCKKIKTFIPGIWTQSTAVPVAFERNSAKVSSAMERSLPTIILIIKINKSFINSIKNKYLYCLKTIRKEKAHGRLYLRLPSRVISISQRMLRSGSHRITTCISSCH